MDVIWAPWRYEYFSMDKSRDFLSEAARASDDAAHLVVSRGKSAFLILNRYPYTSGHMMAVPYRKVAKIEELTPDEWLGLREMTMLAQRLLQTVVNAQGFNVGLNLGTCAGAGVADYLHLHIVPRWNGDNNFMPVLADTRVMPEALASLYNKLTAAL